MMPAQLRHSIPTVLIAAALASAPCHAQQLAGAAVTNERVVLSSRAAKAESAAADNSAGDAVRAERRAEATAIRTRLEQGDFHAGDRITLWVSGEQSLSNTFTVRAGNALEIPSLPEISLRGVLRSELRDVLLREISRYIKQPEIQVTTLVNITVLGAVGRPGFYTVAPDAPITDVLMSAGGPTTNSDFARSRIMRDGAEVEGPVRLRRVLESNSTLDEVGIQSGDQIVIGERQHRWQATASVIGVFALVLPTVLLFARRH